MKIKHIHSSFHCIKAILLMLAGCSALSSFAQNNPLWQLHTSDHHSEYVGTAMANGGIGILPWSEPFSIRHVILNHVFDTDGAQGVSRVLQGINPFALNVEIDGEQVNDSCISNWEQTIDMREATHNTRFTAAGKAEISYSVCALRNMPHAGLIRVSLTALSPLYLKVSNLMIVPDSYVSPNVRFNTLYDNDKRMDMLHTSALSRFRQVEVVATSGFMFEKENAPIPVYEEDAQQTSFTVSLKEGETFSFALAGSICSTRDFTDPYNESERQIIYTIQQGIGSLMDDHRHRWDELWQSDIQIEGDDDAQRIVRFALFNLYSSVREGSALSISPMGLSSQGYNGHIFWDAELWIYPPILLLNQRLARSMVDYRIRRMDAAYRRANTYGYRGVMFPWESDDSGEESTPTYALTGPFEHHITADIAIICWQYYCVTQDRQWLLTQGYPLLRDAADFWVSRAKQNEDGSYSLCHLQGADEYAKGVDDNAFTNGAAICALKDACKAAQACGYTPSPFWTEVGEKLRILSFPNGVTREHSTYDGGMIKQADANLLSYPLGVITDTCVWKKDMEYYSERIDPKDGPAMSYSIFCVQYARMGNKKKAYEMFRRCYEPNLRAPFDVLAETPTTNNPYFMTGAGGLLQAVVNGFCGLQITDNGVVQLSSVLPEHWKKVTVSGVGPEKKTFVRDNHP